MNGKGGLLGYIRKQFRRELGISGQLITGIVITTIAAIGLIGIISVSVLQSSTLMTKSDEAKLVGRLLRTTLLEESGPMADERVAKLAESIVSEARITAMSVKNPSGKIVFSHGKLPVEKGRVLSSSEGLSIYRVGGEDPFEGPVSMLYVSVSDDMARRTQYTAEFTLSMSGVAAHLKDLRSFIIFYAIVDSIIIMAFGIYFFSAYVVRPLRRLEQAATRIAAGNLDERAKIVRVDEIGRLGKAFNTMAAKLEGEILTLERTNVALVDAREELLRTTTLAAVGRLAAGIAHEIGNPLGALSGYLGILERGDVDDEEGRDIVLRAERELARIDKIVKEFLDLSRSPKTPLEAIDVNGLVRDTLEPMAKDKEGLTLALDLTGDIGEILIDEGKLRQVFINLFSNAADAMDGRGVITVETCIERRTQEVASAPMRRVSDDVSVGEHDDAEDAKSATGRRTREFIAVSFADTGVGVAKEDMDKIFDPFFTTKEAGQGTGLGLFVSESIIKAFGGMIEVQSRIGGGTVFKVLLLKETGEGERTRH